MEKHVDDQGRGGIADYRVIRVYPKPHANYEQLNERILDYLIAVLGL